MLYCVNAAGWPTRLVNICELALATLSTPQAISRILAGRIRRKFRPEMLTIQERMWTWTEKPELRWWQVQFPGGAEQHIELKEEWLEH